MRSRRIPIIIALVLLALIICAIFVYHNLSIQVIVDNDDPPEGIVLYDSLYEGSDGLFVTTNSTDNELGRRLDEKDILLKALPDSYVITAEYEDNSSVITLLRDTERIDSFDTDSRLIDIAYADGYICFADGKSLCCRSLESKTVRVLKDDLSGKTVKNLIVYEGKLYYTDDKDTFCIDLKTDEEKLFRKNRVLLSNEADRFVFTCHKSLLFSTPLEIYNVSSRKIESFRFIPVIGESKNTAYIDEEGKIYLSYNDDGYVTTDVFKLDLKSRRMVFSFYIDDLDDNSIVKSVQVIKKDRVPIIDRILP